jgi:hypothetical protein
MAKKPKNDGKPWTPSQEKKLNKLIKENTPTGLISWELGRTKPAIYAHVSEKGKSVKPTNQSPYNRRKRRQPIPYESRYF